MLCLQTNTFRLLCLDFAEDIEMVSPYMYVGWCFPENRNIHCCLRYVSVKKVSTVSSQYWQHLHRKQYRKCLLSRSSNGIWNLSNKSDAEAIKRDEIYIITSIIKYGWDFVKMSIRTCENAFRSYVRIISSTNLSF